MHQLALTAKIIHYQLDENARFAIVIYPLPNTSPIPGVMLALVPALEVLRNAMDHEQALATAVLQGHGKQLPHTSLGHGHPPGVLTGHPVGMWAAPLET